jgi:hypothetical protein
MSDFHDVQKYERILEKIEVKKMLALEKALTGDDANDIIKATKYMAQREERNDSGERKFNFVDPFVFQNFLGFKDKPIMATYNTLRAMAKSPIPNAIIRTRVNEVGDFSEPQKDIYSKGFVIKKKKLPGMVQRMYKTYQTRRK